MKRLRFVKLDQKLQVWSQGRAELRQVQGDFWNVVRFSLTLNGIIIVAMFAFWRANHTLENAITIIILSVIGLIFTCIAYRIFDKHREYFVDILLQVSLIERELGFFDLDNEIRGVKILPVPYRLSLSDLNQALEDTEKWKDDFKWKNGTMARLLRYNYWIIFGIYIITIVIVLFGFCQGYFVQDF